MFRRYRRTVLDSDEIERTIVEVNVLDFESVDAHARERPRFFQQLVDEHVIELLDRQNTIGVRENPNKADYIAPRGIASVVRYFFEQAGNCQLHRWPTSSRDELLAVEMNLSKRVTKIHLNADSHKFHVFSNDEQFGEAEAVIVTVPVPQVLTQFQGSIAQFLGRPSLLARPMIFTYSFRLPRGSA